MLSIETKKKVLADLGKVVETNLSQIRKIQGIVSVGIGISKKDHEYFMVKFSGHQIKIVKQNTDKFTIKIGVDPKLKNSEKLEIIQELLEMPGINLDNLECFKTRNKKY